MKLPDAPLLEVVFELHWDVTLTAQPPEPIPFGYDPGFEKFEKNFDAAIPKLGYEQREVMGTPGPSIAHAITNRYRWSGGNAFPLVQIGHGIFAFNVSTDYDWQEYKKLALDTLQVAIQCYPRNKLAPMAVSRMELRYIDIFNIDFLQHSSLGRFLREYTKMDYAGLPFLDSDQFAGDDVGQIRLKRALASSKTGWFQLETGNAEAGGNPGILLTSRVVKETEFDDEQWLNKMHVASGEWLEEAHRVTSTFFKEFISDDLMKAFKGK